MGDLVVIAPVGTADGFALGGARVVPVDLGPAPEDGSAALAHEVESALAAGAAIVAVHHTLWALAAAPVRTRWEQRVDRLVFSLPPDDGAAAHDRAADLHALLARAVGYEISFSPDGEP